MFEWLKRLGGDGRSLDPIIEEFKQMLLDGRHMFDLGANALLGGTKPDAVRDDLFNTDKKINATEQKLRRDLIVHASVHGAAEFPSCLILMSIGKDAERIGDYCKNVFDLAVAQAIPPSNPEFSQLNELKRQVSDLLGETVMVYNAQDEEHAKKLIKQADSIQDICDAGIDKLVTAENTTGESVAVALAYRYVKRITGHCMNVITSVVMPVDKLDFFDER